MVLRFMWIKNCLEKIDFYEKNIIGLVVVVFIGFLALMTFQALSVCTQLACNDNLTIEIPEKIPSDNLVILVDGITTVDYCNNLRAPHPTLGTIVGMEPYYQGKLRTEDNLITDIDLLQIGYRETCVDDITFVYSYENVSTEYRTYYPNGPYCGGSCYQGTISLN